MIENVSTQLTVFHCFAHCLLPGRAFASLYALLFLEKEAEIGGRDGVWLVSNMHLFRWAIQGQLDFFVFSFAEFCYSLKKEY